MYTLRRISCEKQVVPVRVSHATREIETQVEESARKAQGKRKESARRVERASNAREEELLSLVYLTPRARFPCTFHTLSLRLPPFA